MSARSTLHAPRSTASLSAEDWALYAAQFFPSFPPAQREAAVRELFADALSDLTTDH